MNSWSISGEILKFGVKGQKYPKLWIQVELPTCSPNITENKFFVNFDIDPNPNSKKGKAAAYIKAKLKDHRFFFLADATIANVQTSKKLEDGTWQNEDVVGVRANISNLVLSKERYAECNVGMASGIVSLWNHDPTSNIEKFITMDSYRNVSTGEYKDRPIPVLHENPANIADLSKKKVFTVGKLCGQTPSGESKVFALAKTVIVQ